MSYLSVSDYLLACKEEKAREFATYLFTALFEEFNDTYSRQEVSFCFQHLCLLLWI
jgi:Fanconi anemia group D2 protein